MGQDVTLEFENHSQSRHTRKIVQPSCRSKEKAEDCKKKRQTTSRYYHLKSSDGDFRELPLDRIPNFHCKSLPSRTFEPNLEENAVLKRGSMYQSSREVRRMRKLKEGRRKIDSAYDEGAFLSFKIVDSVSQPSTSEILPLCKENRSPLVALYAEPKSSSSDPAHPITGRSVEFLDLSFRDLPEKRLKGDDTSSPDFSFQKMHLLDELLEISLDYEETKSHCRRAAPGKSFPETDTVGALPKSFSTKVGLVDSPSQPEVVIKNATSKARPSPFKRMLDPIMKSKSMRSSSLLEPESANLTDPVNVRRNGISRKSLLNDFSKATKNLESTHQSVGEDRFMTTASSPAHLHAVLKLDFNNGVPSFEFSTKYPEDVLSAKAWKTGNAYNWVYTFHSYNRRISSGGRSSKDKHGHSPPIVGQMQVSCYLCSEVRDDGVLSNSTVTEFVLYDIAQARRSFAVEERTQYSSSSVHPSTSSVAENLGTSEQQHHLGDTLNSSCDYPASTSYPWSQSDLHPHLEIAAIVIQIPFNKKDCLRELKRRGVNLPNATSVDQRRETTTNISCPNVVKVVTPSGPHGLPNGDDAGPSSLLDRWRFGGGCDCGGWDMSCPVVVFENPCDDDWANCLTMESKKPLELFVQGSKEKIPALSIMADGKGQYSIYFHAQLSALQAFSICIAMLHCSEASSAVVGQEKNKHKLYSNSLKLLLEEEVRQLIEAVALEEKKKTKKKAEQIPPAFLLDPPFSPMGRV
ncbi:uncharacterized protein LOC109713599 [Ananas comosus]|uniref:Uncharacterized protein LOC109713599 n=1 Tax=Ananas comosus TaxID=4615 RepID=A0A6P5FCH4_ANACO|nr:uncharacterized protein LOC109713599 [Ananas comosus]XP_020093317.1 uncharacterized protein LOC109713599 [Ananas comosus]XP_020093319.1 uncharacterized protein LOC109713599 [Ananas comosus]XP_020093320.1 uncharacterized protein LOC109713599 [Ananas comosus]XP_020093321.1 uncharacterized protein LOC109713599 [Ananas comosus]